MPKSTNEGYAVNRLVAARLGWEPLGWKIAGTTQAVRDKLSTAPPETLATAIRQHWAIENRQHWVLDVNFGEDRSPVRERNAARNLAVLQGVGEG